MNRITPYLDPPTRLNWRAHYAAQDNANRERRRVIYGFLGCVLLAFAAGIVVGMWV